MTLLPEIERSLLDAVRRDHQLRRHGPLGAIRVWLRARPRGLVLLAGVLLVGGSAAAAVSLSGQPSAPLSGTVPAGRQGPGGSSPGSSYRIALFPDISAGLLGWCHLFILNGGSGRHRGPGGFGGCGDSTPTLGDPIFALDDTGGPGLHYVLTAPNVAAVQIAHGPTIATRSDPSLPFGFRAAVFYLPWRPGLTVHRARRGSSWAFLPLPALTALDAAGRPIPGSQGGGSAQEQIRRWNYPGREAKGSCSIHAGERSGLQERTGAVVTSIVGDPAILGRGFLSCIDVGFDADGYMMRAAVLLDAEHPGSRPGALPDMHPVPRSPGFLDRPTTRGGPPAQYAGSGRFYPGPLNAGPLNGLTARRVGEAWLVVEGGTGTQQRLRALRDLTVGPIDLRLAPTPLPAPSNARCWLSYRPLAGLQEVSANLDSAVSPCQAGVSFYYNGWPIDATVSMPGPAAVFKTTTPIARRRNELTVTTTDGGSTSTVRHTGKVWLEVDGGSGPAQQQALLDDLIVQLARTRAGG